MKVLRSWLWLAALGVAGYAEEPGVGGQTMAAATVLPQVTLKIVYNNYAGKEGLTADWGFGCVIEAGGRRLLFDTGARGGVLLKNLEQLGIDPGTIDTVALSHIHWDHTGGLADFLKRNHQVTVFVPPSFPNDFKEEVRGAGARCEDVAPGTAILPGVWSTGELGGAIKEQAVFCATPQGLVVVTGCAHPGVVEMVRAAKQVAGEVGLENREVALVTGGFHMLQMTEPQVRGIIGELRALGVRRAAPSHCSGDRTRELFREAFGADYLDGDLGSVLTIGKPPTP